MNIFNFVQFCLTMPVQASRRERRGRAGGGRKHLEFPAGGDQGVKFKFGLE